MTLRKLIIPIVASAFALGLGGCAIHLSDEPTTTSAADDTATGSTLASVGVSVGGPVTITDKTVTLAPGKGTGRHCHYGYVVGVVVQGELTHHAPIYPTGVHTYHKGDAIIEGPGYLHDGKNDGRGNTVLKVTYFTPQGKPLAETDPAKCAAIEKQQSGGNHGGL
ncbi:hypothetical protein ACIRCZ_19680 [Leifsonia sp. NPDC102414]|uniref:hypothetical protein n=1 Tax=Leifsonia sp. NPDC102414 TaxID=3364124 RepID=UPI00382584C1